MKALILNASLKTATVTTIPTPTLSSIPPTHLLIRTAYIALNPVDALYTSHPLAEPTSRRTVGSDFSGVVVGGGATDVGDGDDDFLTVPPTHSRPGTRVAGFLQGACSVNDLPGAFAEYVVVPWDLVWIVPDGMGLEQAATVSLCGLTAAQGLFYRLGIPAPWEEEEEDQQALEKEKPPKKLNVFIYGASTSVGLYAAQLVRLAAQKHGVTLRLLGAASRGRHEALEGQPYGYDGLVDYRDEGWEVQVRELCGGGDDGVQYAVDCISEGLSVEKVSRTLGEDGKLAIFRSREGGAWDATNMPAGVDPVYGAVWEGLGVDVQYQGMVLPGSSRAREFAASFYRYLSSGRHIEPNPVRLMPGGLEGVVADGFALLGSGSMDDREVKVRSEPWMKPISMEKLVYDVVGESRPLGV